MSEPSEKQAGHTPVLLHEAIAALNLSRGGVFIDATFGGGGYSEAMLAEPSVRVIGLDRDPDAIARGQALRAASQGRLRLIETRFSALAEVAAEQCPQGVDGIVLDIGVSSYQIDQAERGFSFMADGPLDMRMQRDGVSAQEAVALATETQLADVFFHFGEEPEARRIAKAVVTQRRLQPITTTGRLADIVSDAVGGRKGARTHPATRVFQALRLWVNDELGELAAVLSACERVLNPGGRLAIVSFHSLEDRMVKTFLRERAGETGEVSRHMPVVDTGPPPSFRLLSKSGQAPTAAEAEANPRARSARLRTAERTSDPAWLKPVDRGVPHLPLQFREV
jgi:16S rRNA (cytosine1402-N4)-methyltransferase